MSFGQPHASARTHPDAQTLEVVPSTWYRGAVLQPKFKRADDGAATRVYPEMPNYVGTEAELLAAIDVGIADIRAGQTVSFEEVAFRFRRNRIDRQ